MSTVTKTVGRDLPNGDYLEVTAEERDGSDGLSAGFAITGSLWEKRRQSGRARKRLGRDTDRCGAIHEDIARHFPALAPLVAVHLADQSGLPMHALANGWYYYSGKAAAYERASIAAGRDYGYSRYLEVSDHDRAAESLHIAPEDLPAGLDEDGFVDFVGSLAETHQRQAAQARAVLESLVDGDGVEGTA